MHEGLGLDPQCWVWWHTPIITNVGEVKAGVAEVQGHVDYVVSNSLRATTWKKMVILALCVSAEFLHVLGIPQMKVISAGLVNHEKL